MKPIQYNSVLAALKTFIDPSTPAVELRALGVNGDETHAGWFTGQTLEAMAKAALELDPKSRGVYFTPNPLSGPAAGQSVGQVKRRSGGETAKDSDIAVRRWLLIDADPVRMSEDGEILDTSLPATDAENAEAYRLIDHVRAIMEGTFGFLGPVVASSGNGWHVCYPVDMPNDEVSKVMHRDLLRGLDKRCSNVNANIDTKTYNAARIWKVYATKSRKGIESVGRGHRWAGMLDGTTFDPEHRLHNVERLKVMLKRWASQDEIEARENAPVMPSSSDAAPYAKKALDMEVSAVQSAGPGNRNNSLNEASFKLGTLVGGGLLSRQLVEESLLAAGVSNGLSESECRATIRSGLEGGLKSPRVAPEKPAKVERSDRSAREVRQDTKTVYTQAGLGNYGTSESTVEKRPLPTSMEDIAGVEDLVKAGAKLRWLWKGWIQIGVVNILAAAGGCGKCLGKGTPVMMFDGTIKKVEDIWPGDRLMGPDSKPRNVLSLARGREMMYRITPVKGDPYIVNESHILSLRHRNDQSEIWNVSVRKLKEDGKLFVDPWYCFEEWHGWRVPGIMFGDLSIELDKITQCEEIGVDDYYGFEIDGDSLFLLGDFTVTHNTRLGLDLVKRIKNGLPWPDGQPMEVDPASLTLWVLSDNNHDEIVSASQSFGIVDSIKLNSHPEDPYGGVLISGMDDLCELEARIKIVKPVMVFIDTVGNATDLNLSKQEDAKAFYQPLQVIARRHSVAIMCLTHLNANGGTLGRRANEKVRSVINMDKPDPDQENRRKLWVAKSNSAIPKPLGVTMSDDGNEYDDKPPVAPDDGDGRERPTRKPSKVKQCVEWLTEELASGSVSVKAMIDKAEEMEFGRNTLYAAKDKMDVDEFEMGGRKFWRRIVTQNDPAE
jgi:hypothetical protein